MKVEVEFRMPVAQATAETEKASELEQLFWAHQERVLRAAYRITGNLADAEDVAQTVFARLLAAPTVRIDNAETYLYRSAVNGALDLLRQRRPQLALDETPEQASSSPECSPDKQLSNRELRHWLRCALAQMAPISAEMFVLRYLEGYDNREIAKLFCTSRAVVAVRLHQTRAELKRRFQRSFEAKK